MNVFDINFILTIFTTVIGSFAVLLLFFFVLRYYFIYSHTDNLVKSEKYSIVRQHSFQFANGIQHCSTKIDS